MGAERSDGIHNGACHCQKVRFRVRLTGGFAEARRCDCSFCRMRGAVALTAMREDVEIIAGADRLTRYQFGTNTAEHFFCSVCGIYTHHFRRSDPRQAGINAACLEGVSPFDFQRILVLDGRHHPSDGQQPGSGVVGELHYIPRE